MVESVSRETLVVFKGVVCVGSFSGNWLSVSRGTETDSEQSSRDGAGVPRETGCTVSSTKVITESVPRET